MTDPYTIVYDAIVAALVDSQAMNAAVTKLRSKIINYNEIKNGVPEKFAEGQLPIIAIDPKGLSAELVHSSSTVKITRAHKILLSTDSGRSLSESLYPLEWALTCALLGANFSEKVRSLTWKDAQFIYSVNILGVDSGFGIDSNGLANNSYAAIWDIRVVMILPRAKMLEFNSNPNT